jgi:trimeric autotransporter adhesin
VSDANAGFVRFQPRVSTRSALESLARQLLFVFTVSILALASLSCGSSHAILEISAPATVVAGVPFSATVTAMYNGKRDTIIDGPIHFTTSDAAAQLPTLYVFTAADAGSHTFTDLTLVTPGNQTMTVSDYDATPIAGTVNIVVTAPTAKQ